MVSPHGIQLAEHLISTFYGDLCSKVSACLLRRGTLTLSQIIQFTGLSRENVINCLRVLIHQNCVQAFAFQQEGHFGEAPRIVTQYMALFDNMIHKLRSPKFMHIVSDELGKDCLGIFQGLIQHGRLSLNQIIDRNHQTGGSSDVSVVRESFSRLVNARFIERCPAPEPFLAPPAEGETPAKKRKAAKLAPEPTTEQRVLTAAAPMESMRFLMEMDDPSEEKDDQSTDGVKPGKRKQDVLKFDEDGNKEVLWRVNFEELVRRLRHKACVSYVKTKHNNEAGIVLSAMLELSTRSAYPINEIYNEAIKKEGGVGMDYDRIRTSLEELGCEALSTEVGEIYSLDINSIIEMAREEEVESVVLRRYGLEAYRIFRLLTKAGRLVESDMIAGSVFVEKKDTTSILYKLWKAEFVHLERVRTSAAKQALFLLWGVNRDSLKAKVVDEMYHAVLNLRLRNKHDLDQGEEVLQLPREKLVGDLEKKYKRLLHGRAILESSLMNLDDAILLFNN